MNYPVFAAALQALAAIFLSAGLAPAVAHEGHDHGAPPLPVQLMASLAPRMEATTPEFQLLAAFEAGSLVVWLDRAASNEPVSKAQIEVEITAAGAGAAVKGVLQERADGAYALPVPALAVPGDHALVFSVITPDGGDLLNGTLTIPAPTEATATNPLQPPLIAGAIMLLVAIGLGTLWLRRRRAT